jgi:predicted dehydrogenase
MARASTVKVAIIGLGFGAEFVPIYLKHPHAELAAICQLEKKRLDKIGDAFGIQKRYTSYDDVLSDPSVDAVHINTPIPDHAAMSIAALEAGKHVACTVPAATSVADCRKLVAAQKRARRNYMMMETMVYTREFLYVKELYRKGVLGRIQFLRGSHQQDMSGWPSYWEGLPPMHYGTHCISPCLCLMGKTAESVVCVGSGRIDPKLARKHGSPFAVETAVIKLKNSNLACEVTRSLFNTARQYRESFDVYADQVSFEWPQIEGEPATLHRGGKPQRVTIPDYAHLLPKPIRLFTTHCVYGVGQEGHLSFTQGSGHGGSHPHLVHEFVMSIAERRPPMPDVRTGVNWTLAGICAHQSAMKGGTPVKIPQF